MSARTAYAETPLWELELLLDGMNAELAPDEGRVMSSTPQPRGSDSPFSAAPDLKGI